MYPTANGKANKRQQHAPAEPSENPLGRSPRSDHLDLRGFQFSSHFPFFPQPKRQKRLALRKSDLFTHANGKASNQRPQFAHQRRIHRKRSDRSILERTRRIHRKSVGEKIIDRPLRLAPAPSGSPGPGACRRPAGTCTARCASSARRGRAPACSLRWRRGEAKKRPPFLCEAVGTNPKKQESRGENRPCLFKGPSMTSVFMKPWKMIYIPQRTAK